MYVAGYDSPLTLGQNPINWCHIIDNNRQPCYLFLSNGKREVKMVTFDRKHQAALKNMTSPALLLFLVVVSCGGCQMAPRKPDVIPWGDGFFRRGSIIDLAVNDFLHRISF